VYSKANVEGLAALAGHQPAKHMPLSQNELLDMLDKLRQSQMLIAAVRDAYLSAVNEATLLLADEIAAIEKAIGTILRGDIVG